MSTSHPDAAVAGEPRPDDGGGVQTRDDGTDASAAAVLGGGGIVADSFGEYIGAQWKKVKGGESGVLPVVIGLILIIVIFQTKNGKFLSGGNLVNLIDQGAFIMVLGMAEVFVLLLGEIDLSAGFNMAIGATVTAELAAPPHNVPWFLAILAGIAACVVISTVVGLLITRLRLPSFIVTLAFFLGLQGVLLSLFSHDSLASGGNINISNKIINDIVNGYLSPTAGWIVMIAAVVVFAALNILGDRRRRQSGLVTPPLTLTLLKIAAVAVAGVVVVLVCNHNRGGGFIVIRGVPWVIPIVLVVLIGFTFLLGRTRFGRYLYAIGGNAEAARRAGISLNRIRLTAFMLAGLMAGIAGVLYESYLGSISSNVDGGTNVLYAVAAAVIGGTSLFGGRGKMLHAVLGGVIIAAIANGMGLIQLSAATTFIVNALVLLAAVTVDAVGRRGRTAGV
jgi:D-xylose transport system permease protein